MFAIDYESLRRGKSMVKIKDLLDAKVTVAKRVRPFSVFMECTVWRLMH
jgi:hypothetical protein